MAIRQIRVTGRVQGVGYRDALRDEAVRIGVTGWVRNRADGSVEALLQGETEELERLIEWARRGPPAARVERLEHLAPAAAEDRVHLLFERRPSV